MDLEESITKLQELTVRLRQECPWDKKQTHDSLKRHLLEEAYETIEAIDELVSEKQNPKNYENLKDELGDLLYQVFFHALLASEAGQFELQDVIQNIHDKLIRRHPHIFEGLEIKSEEDLAPRWEEIKKAEKNTESVMDNLSTHLPALLLATKIQKKAKAIGLFDEINKNNSQNKIKQEEILGELLWEAVSFSIEHNIDAEDILRKTAKEFAEKVRKEEIKNKKT